MIRKKKIFKFFRILEIYYEAENIANSSIEGIWHISGRVFSYLPLTLKGGYKLSRVKETTRITLVGKNPESLLKSFKKNYRNEIRKTEQMDECQIKSCIGFSKDGYKMYKNFEHEAKRLPISPKNIDGLWFLAYLNEELVSGVYLVDADPVLKVVAIFSSRLNFDQKKKNEIGFLSKRLIYEIGCYGIEKRYKFVDLAYINRTDPKKAGITSFKLGFKGEIVDEYLYEKSSSLIIFLKKFKKNIT